MHCSKLYHQAWFRVLLVIVGMDMFIFGFLFAADIDVFAMIPQMHIVLHLVFGFMYMLVAAFIIHYALDYHKIKKQTRFVCHHCGEVNIVIQKEKED